MPSSTSAQEVTPGTPEWLTRPVPELEVEATNERDDNELRTDRDAYTIVPTTVRPGQSIIESSYSYIDNPGFPSTHSFPELLVRVGLTERAELRLGWNYDVGGSSEATDVSSEFDFASPTDVNGNFLFGVKLRLLDGEGWRPATSMALVGITPTSGGDNTTDPAVDTVFEWKLRNDWLLGVGMRYAVLTEPGEYYNQWSPSAVLRIPFGERWNAHAEYFGVTTDGNDRDANQQYFSPGGHFEVTENFEIGLRFIIGLTPTADSFVANTGIGLRF